VQDTFAMMPAAALTGLHMDPPQPVPGIGDGGCSTGCPPRPSTPSSRRSARVRLAAAVGELRQLGGALDRIADDAAPSPSSTASSR